MDDQTEIDDIPRAKEKLSRDQFALIFDLHFKQPWLRFKQSELLSLLELCDSYEDQQLICDLLLRFHFVDAEEFSARLTKVRDMVVSDWKLLPENTKLVAIRKSSYADSSDAILYLLKNVFGELEGWETNAFVAGARQMLDLAEDGTNMVFVDEFIGTGETMRKLVDWVKEQLALRSIYPNFYVCTLAAMEKAREQLDACGARYHSVSWLQRGISDYFVGNELIDATQRMERLEEKLCDVSERKGLKKYLFGYKRSEALYHWKQGNVPNNVFPIFWWRFLKPEIRRRPLLTRI